MKICTQGQLILERLPLPCHLYPYPCPTPIHPPTNLPGFLFSQTGCESCLPLEMGQGW